MRTPKHAVFFLSNPEVHWLRWASPVTFKLQHPSWEVIFYTDAKNLPSGYGVKVATIEKPPLIPSDVWDKAGPVTKSDLWRWWYLYEFGGLYADTDVIFVKNLEPIIDNLDNQNFQMGMTLDTGTVIGGSLRISIGVVTSQPKCSFFQKALLNLISDNLIGYQDAGTVGLRKYWYNISTDVKIGNIPANLIYPFDSRSKSLPWSSAQSLPDECFAIHWYGGARGLVVGPYDKLQNCPVKQALIKSGWRPS